MKTNLWKTSSGRKESRSILTNASWKLCYLTERWLSSTSNTRQHKPSMQLVRMPWSLIRPWVRVTELMERRDQWDSPTETHALLACEVTYQSMSMCWQLMLRSSMLPDFTWRKHSLGEAPFVYSSNGDIPPTAWGSEQAQRIVYP